MAITSVDALVAAMKDGVPFVKTNTATTVAAQWHTLFDRAGNPGAGNLTIGNTTNGVVPTGATAGFPPLRAFSGGAEGVIHSIAFSNTVASRFRLMDRLFHAGSFLTTPAAPTTYTLTSIPDATARMPDGIGVGNEIWVEINTAVAASAVTVQVGYTSSDGTTGRLSSVSASLSGFITGRLVQLGLQAGDVGVRQITSVIVGGSAAATGSFNVILARQIYNGMRVPVAGGGDVHGFDKTGLRRVYDSSALWPIVAPDSTSSGVPEILMNVSSG